MEKYSGRHADYRGNVSEAVGYAVGGRGANDIGVSGDGFLSYEYRNAGTPGAGPENVSSKI